MIFSRYERMIARRYLLPQKGEGFIFVVAGFSVAAVALGVAALIIVMSVKNGFRAELFDKIVGLNGHAMIQGVNGSLPDWQRIADAAVEKFRLHQVLLHHRIGFVPAGEASLFVRVRSQHRAAAFEASQWIVDELKKKVPIWKKPQLKSQTRITSPRGRRLQPQT